MIFKRKYENEYEKNSKKYIRQKFQFLTECGYSLRYYFKNGEELFSYSTSVCNIEIINDPNYVDVIIRYGQGFPYDSEYNIRGILSIQIDNDIKMLAPIQIIDYFATVVSQNIDYIERFGSQ